MAFTNSQGRTQSSLADINVTPLVDVVLVLLIIFMVTAPVLQSGIEVEVPHTKTVKEITEERLVITIDRQQKVFLNNDAININQIGARIRQKIRDPAGAIGLHSRRPGCSLRRLRHRDGRREASRHYQREHRYPTAGEEWQPTLTSFRKSTRPAVSWIGSAVLHAALFALALFGYLLPSGRGENWGGTEGGGGAMSATSGQQHSAAQRAARGAERARQRVEGPLAIAAQRNPQGGAEGDPNSSEGRQAERASANLPQRRKSRPSKSLKPSRRT